MPLKHGTTNISVLKNSSDTSIFLDYAYHGTTRVFAYYQTYTITYSATTPGIASIVVNRTSSPRAEAATGNLASGANIYTGDVLNITVTAESGYYVYNSDTRDSSTVTETITVNAIVGNITRTYQAVQKLSVSVSGRTGTVADANGYYYTSGITTSISNAITSGVYVPYVYSFGDGGYSYVSSYSSSSATCVLKSTNSNTVARGTLFYYQMAGTQTNPLTEDPYVEDFNTSAPFFIVVNNDNDVAVVLEVRGYVDTGTDTWSESDWFEVDTIPSRSALTVDDAFFGFQDANLAGCELYFRFKYTSGGTTFYSEECSFDY